MKKLLLLLLFSTSLSLAQTTIYLVRHAEKIINKEIKDPGLTAIGQFRALNIAKQLSKVGITTIYSSNYKRTLQTAQPLAEYLKIPIKKYDPRKLDEFTKEIMSMHGNILIVGHSNTTPKLTSLISGKQIAPIEEKHEYDNLYQVILLDGQTLVNRFKTIPSYELNANKVNRQQKTIKD